MAMKRMFGLGATAKAEQAQQAKTNNDQTFTTKGDGSCNVYATTGLLTQMQLLFEVQGI